jgi:hypothetical protein
MWRSDRGWIFPVIHSRHPISIKLSTSTRSRDGQSIETRNLRIKTSRLCQTSVNQQSSRKAKPQEVVDTIRRAGLGIPPRMHDSGSHFISSSSQARLAAHLKEGRDLNRKPIEAFRTTSKFSERF